MLQALLPVTALDPLLTYIHNPSQGQRDRFCHARVIVNHREKDTVIEDEPSGERPSLPRILMLDPQLGARRRN